MPFQQLFKEGINFRFKLFILNLVRAYLRTLKTLDRSLILPEVCLQLRHGKAD